MVTERENGEEEQVPWLEPVQGDEIDGRMPLDPKKLITLGAGVAVLILVAMITYFYLQAGDPGAPLLVKAPDTPIKVEPEDRGGMDVPHQDKLVLDPPADTGLSDNDTLLPGPEEPLERPEPRAEEKIQIAAVDKNIEAKEPETSIPEEIGEVDDGMEHLIQLGAFSSKESAAMAWVSLKGNFPTSLKDLKALFEEVVIGGKTFVRLRATPFDNRAGIEKICGQLVARHVPCMPVSRQRLAAVAE